MKILVKFPSRGRPGKFYEVWYAYMALSENKNDIYYMISLDDDDPMVYNYPKTNMIGSWEFFYGKSKSKIDACNRDMDKSGDWDIVVLASDDMAPEVQGWDTQIIKAYETYFPDLDGVVHFNDGYQKGNCATMVIMGRKYYERFGYLYNPEYRNLWCDVEFTEVAHMLGRYVYMGDGNVIIRHKHPFTDKNIQTDAQYQAQSSQMSWEYDKKVFDSRRARNYDLKPEEIVNGYKYGKL